MYKMDLALNKLQWLIYRKNQPNQIKEINSDDSFNVPVNYQHLFFVTDHCVQDFSLPGNLCVSTLWTVFRFRLVVVNPCLVHW